MKVMVDFFAGLGGASQYANLLLDWHVITVDIEEKYKPDIVWDIMKPGLREKIPRNIEFCWFSPPCTEFTKDFQPWHESNIDLSLFKRCFDLVLEIRPKYWIIENVIGAQKFFGRALFHLGPYYFWGWVPKIESSTNFYGKSKLFPSEDRASLRAKIPFEVSKIIIDKIQ